MILRADARAIPLADQSVQCVVTSPPYWGLRDYGIAGQIGLEPTPEAYVATMVGVFREVGRVLKDDGVAWLNLGDSYAGGGRGGRGGDSGSDKQDSNKGCLTMPVSYLRRPGVSRADGIIDGRSIRNRDGLGDVPGLKPKDLCGMPWRVAFALQADGWYLRSDVIWAKPNPMPESVTDRPTRSHEYIFLLSKSERYFYDAEAIREPAEYGRRDTAGQWRGGAYVNQKGAQDNSNGNGGFNSVTGKHPETGRNKRDVWTVNSEPTPEAHFATFPQKLIEPCILVGTSEKGECSKCGKNWVRSVDVSYDNPGSRTTNGPRSLERRHETAGFPIRLEKRVETTGWQPQCACDAPMRPNIVLDPFLGSGTVGKVCERFGRRWVGLELSAEYIKIARRRSAQMGLLLGFGAKP